MEHFGGKPFKCEHCDKSFALVHTLNSHLKTHLELDELKRLTCDQVWKLWCFFCYEIRRFLKYLKEPFVKERFTVLSF